MAAPEVQQGRSAQLVASDGEAGDMIEIRIGENPIADRTLGDLGVGVQVEEVPGPSALLRIQVANPLAHGIAPETIRMFRVDDGQVDPIWNSGYAVGTGFVWAIVTSPGVYVPIGLPRDRLLEAALQQIAVDRRVATGIDGDGRKDGGIASLLDGPPQAIGELRRFVASLELQTGIEPARPDLMERGTGGHLAGYLLPGGLDLGGFRKRAAGLQVPAEGLPEETLFFPPDPPQATTPPWMLAADSLDWDGVTLERLRPIESILDKLRDVVWLRPFPWPWPWLWSKNWWMHQHDQRHTGHASGPSDITRTSVNRMKLIRTLPVDGPVVSKPAIVGGTIYVGSGRQGGSGGTLYKFDLVSGAKLGEFPTSGSAFYGWVNGIGGSPAVTGGRVYFTGVHGKVYCLDASTMTPVAPHPAPLWEVDLNVASVAMNQPVNQPNADCWSGPLVVGDRVYIGCGEGEDAYTYGFIYCLDANTGRVRWLFCTAKFGGVANNAPNTIPSAVAASWATAAGFSVTSNAPETGSSVWSSCAYDSVLDRIYVGTGNSEYDWTGTGTRPSGTEQPDDPYGSGLLSLDATSGAFRAFFQPSRDDSYWPGDLDIDVPGGPSVIYRGSDRVVAFGSKNGSFFLLDPDTLAPIARRQMLPRVGGSGVPGDRGAAVAAIVPTGGSGENSYGIFGTPAVHSASGRIFIGLGGYNGMALDAGAGIDSTRTPFIRAVNWSDLQDAWPTALGGDGIRRYTVAKPPVYTSREVGLSSPAVVNDVVFVSTDKAALYGLDVTTGQCLWSAPGLPSGGMSFALGPAIYGNYVVLGVGPNVYVYRLGWRFPFEPWRIPIDEIIRYPWPPPPPNPPDPPPFVDRPPIWTAQLVALAVVAVIAVVLAVVVAAIAIRS
jgi:outer membrane protein assembly factor BamB